MLTIPLLDALENSKSAIALRAAALLRAGTARVSASIANHAALAPTLRLRLELKRSQAISGNANVIAMRDSLDTLLSWWDAHADQTLLYEYIHTDSEVAFLFWRNSVSGLLLTGFETRNAKHLTAEGGAAFWGPDWRPPSEGT